MTSQAAVVKDCPSLPLIALSVHIDTTVDQHRRGMATDINADPVGTEEMLRDTLPRMYAEAFPTLQVFSLSVSWEARKGTLLDDPAVFAMFERTEEFKWWRFDGEERAPRVIDAERGWRIREALVVADFDEIADGEDWVRDVDGET